MTEQQQNPASSPESSSPGRARLVDELMIDIYANPVLKTLVILIDRPFEDKITGLELDRNSRNLVFVFGDLKKDLGDPLQPALMPYFEDRRQIEIFQLDMKTKQPVASWLVPLAIIS